jgi:hypothetical protein
MSQPQEARRALREAAQAALNARVSWQNWIVRTLAGEIEIASGNLSAAERALPMPIAR